MTGVGDLSLILPELLLGGGLLVLLLVGVFGGERSTQTVNVATLALLAVAAIAVLGPGGPGTNFDGAFVTDPFARLMKLLVLVSSATALVLSIGHSQRERYARFEYPLLILSATLGMMMMISANDLISLYVAIELQSLSLYVLAAIQRDSVRSTEAGLKYFVLGALASGMLLYGASLIYGFTGQTGFPAIAAAMAAGEPGIGLIFGVVFLLAGLAFKIAAVPFHMWTPDVYEGAPTPVTAFMAAAPKIAAMSLLARVTMDALGPIGLEWRQIVVFLSIGSMVLGAFAAIGQRNIKRLMAYSSIGHVGYALLGLAAGTEIGLQGMIVYLIIYMAMTLGAFACIIAMRRHNVALENIEDLAGLSRTNPTMAFILAAIMFSLAGIPPLAGFFGKFFVFIAAIEAGLFVLSVIGVLASVVGAYYYLRIVKVMYFDEPVAAFDRTPSELRAVMVLSGAFTLLFILFAGPVSRVAEAAAHTFF